jgi:pimeloyl-ACP methyl ester carboxylesterase
MPFANNNGVKIHYEVDGQGPPLVVQHGLTSSLERWRMAGRLAPLLATVCRTIMVDARGHGESDKPHDSTSYQPWNFASDILAVLNTIGIQKSGYYGYSMGGAIGFHGIVQYAPDRFDYLILGGMSPYSTEVERREWQIYVGWAQMMVDNGTEAWVSFMEKSTGMAYPPSFRTLMLKNDPFALLAAGNSIIDWPSAENLLPKIKVPCLVFAGEADGFCIGAKKAAAAISNARFISFPGLNHVQVNLHPELLFPHMKSFLDEVNKNY